PPRRAVREAGEDLPGPLRRRRERPHQAGTQVPRLGRAGLQGLHRHLLVDRLRAALAADRHRAPRRGPRPGAVRIRRAVERVRKRVREARHRAGERGASPEGALRELPGALRSGGLIAMPASARPKLGSLIAELQGRGARIERDIGGRRSGAGPADAGMIWIEGMRVTFPFTSDYVTHSPFVLRETSEGWGLYRDGEWV